MFKALANKPFASFLNKPSTLKSKRTIKSIDFDTKSETKLLKEEKEENFSENNPHFLEDLYNNLLCIVNGNKSKEEFELDKRLVYNLVDSNYRKEGESLMKIVSNIIEKTKNDITKNKFDNDAKKQIELKKDDLEKINKKFK